MTEDELYDDLPDDPEVAFLRLERCFRDECERKVREAHQEERVDVYFAEYISKVIAAITELGLAPAFERKVPSIAEVSYNTYIDFGNDVDHYTTALRIRHARRRSGYSVRLDAAAKGKINHYISQLREIFGKLEVPTRKRESLLAKLDVLQAEIDQERTRLEVYGDLVIETAAIAGEVGDKLEPWRKWLDSIGAVIWGQQDEERPQIPAPPKRIEPPRVSGSVDAKDADEEIPF